MPLNGPGNYRVEDNKVFTRAIEINAVHHCNLSCRGCSHSAPISSKKINDPKTIKEDLTYLAKYLKCETVRIVGGEPLLHPKLDELLKVIKQSNICENICLVTNGILLDKINNDALLNIDKIEISLYPIQQEIINKINQEAIKLKNAGKKVTILEYSSFREAISRLKTDDKNIINRIYDTCQIAHFLRCITIENGRLYRCPQSMIYEEKTGDKKDSIEIKSINNINNLLKFLENNNALNSCASCLGSIGQAFLHEQINKNKWEEALPEKTEEAIYNIYLNKLIEDARFETGCMNRKKL